jgi:subtilisin family serine protease
VALSASLVVLPHTATIANYSADFVPHELVCSLTPGASIGDINQQYGTTTKEVIDTVASMYLAYLLSAPDSVSEDSLAAEISLNSTVVYCAPNYYLDAPEPVQRSQPFLDVIGGDDEVQSQAAAIRLDLSTAQTLSTGSGTQVAVIDVGVNATQPMLAGSVLTGVDYVDQDTVANDEPGGVASGHGTFIAGIIKLVAPDVQIVPYRVLDTLGRGDGFSITRAVIDAVQRGCEVINISMVMAGKHPSLDAAIEYARSNDVLVVAAAGNDSTDTPRFPADDSYCLGVAGVDSADLKADFSNFGSHVDVCGPSVYIKGPFLDSSYARWKGTSFAAPFVAGTAALLYSLRPDARWNDIVDAIELSAQGLDGVNPVYAGKLGNGMVDPVAAAQSWWLAPGDVNASGTITAADAVYLVGYIFRSGPPPVNLNAGDVDTTCDITTSDIIYLVGYIFRLGPAPQPGCIQ